MKKPVRKKVVRKMPSVLQRHKLILTAILNLQQRLAKLEKQERKMIGFNTDVQGYPIEPEEDKLEQMEDEGIVLGKKSL